MVRVRAEIHSLKAGILTISDRASRGIYKDKSGPALAGEIRRQGWHAARRQIIADDMDVIKKTLRHWCDREGLDVILTTGGTGLSPRDRTPEATRAVIDRELPGVAWLMLSQGLKQAPLAPLSRAVAGARKRSLIINLPGNPQGAVWSLKSVSHLIEHAVSLLRGGAHDHRS